MKYIFNRYCNTVQEITVEANSQEEAEELASEGEGWEGKEEVLECWDELDEDETKEANRNPHPISTTTIKRVVTIKEA